MRVPLTLVRTDADHNASVRQCGPCNACCVLPRISPTEEPAFPNGKLGYTLCQHLKYGGGGCGIYEDRPSLCRDYLCLWRAGIIEGDDRRRPDQLGLMFTFDTMQDKIVVEVWELWDGAARDHPGRYVIDAIVQRFPVMIRFYGVPASINYTRPQHLELGRQLSDAAMFDPCRLADWLEQQTKVGRLVLEPGHGKEMIDRELELLRQGVPVVKHYRPKK